MPISDVIKAVKGTKKLYDERQKGGDPEIPVPGRARSVPDGTSGPTLAPPSNRQNANTAADMLGIPGKEAIRKGMEKRRKVMDDI